MPVPRLTDIQSRELNAIIRAKRYLSDIQEALRDSGDSPLLEDVRKARRKEEPIINRN